MGASRPAMMFCDKSANDSRISRTPSAKSFFLPVSRSSMMLGRSSSRSASRKRSQISCPLSMPALVSRTRVWMMEEESAGRNRLLLS